MRRYALLFVILAAGTVALAVPASATFPGQNGKLLFERFTGDGSDLFSVGADASGVMRLTRRTGVEGDASWSPDGSKIAVSCARNPESGQFGICVMDADGGGLTRLTGGRAFNIAPAWSPDGTKIVYASDRGADRVRLWVMNADGSGKRLLTRNRRTDYLDPQWSPDGSTIAVGLVRAGDTPRSFDASIGLIDAADGGNLRRVTPRRGADELNPNWSPDGTRIVYEVNRLFDQRQSDIWVMNADGSGKQQLTDTRFYETYPVFSPDGTRIAFSGDRDNRNLSRGRLERGFEIYTMAIDGSGVFRVTNNRRPDVFPDWQPLP